VLYSLRLSSNHNYSNEFTLLLLLYLFAPVVQTKSKLALRTQSSRTHVCHVISVTILSIKKINVISTKNVNMVMLLYDKKHSHAQHTYSRSLQPMSSKLKKNNIKLIINSGDGPMTRKARSFLIKQSHHCTIDRPWAEFRIWSVWMRSGHAPAVQHISYHPMAAQILQPPAEAIAQFTNPEGMEGWLMSHLWECFISKLNPGLCAIIECFTPWPPQSSRFTFSVATLTSDTSKTRAHFTLLAAWR